jgi:TRAP-type C4-dicarboxylate transport system permease small subunit
MKLGRVIHGFESSVHNLSRIVSWIARATLGITALLLTADVFLRSAFDHVIVGTFDLVGLLNVMLASCCIAYTASYRGHIAIGSITSRFTARTRALVNSIAFLFGAAFAGLVAWRMMMRALDEMTLAVGPKTSMLEIPYTPFMILGGVGFFLLALEFLASVTELLGQARTKQVMKGSPTSDAAEGAI